jgi:hypothetical protein
MDFSIPSNYLSIIRRQAGAAGYDPTMLNLATDGVHKAIMTDGKKHVKFGKLGMADFHLLKIAERAGKVPKGESDKRRESYLKRSAGIRGDWANNKYSPNRLSRSILWSV